MGYRKLNIDGKIYEYVIGKKFVKIRGQKEPILVSKCGYKMETLSYEDDKYMITPALLREYITTGKVVQRDEICGKHNKKKFWASDPYRSEINNDDTPCFACEDCFRESAWDI